MKKSSVNVDLVICKKCDYKWYPRIYNDGTVKSPKICPTCHQDWRTKPRVKKSDVENETNKK